MYEIHFVIDRLSDRSIDRLIDLLIDMLDTSLLSYQDLHRQSSMFDDHRSRHVEERDGERIYSFLQPSCE